MNKLMMSTAIVFAGLAGLAGCGGAPPLGEAGAVGGSAAPPEDAAAGDATLARGFAERARNLQVESKGTVVRLLGDDDDGSRHQRFILRLASGQTVLVAHNIDLAPRVRGLRVRDTVAFYGEYEWSEEGGTIHWTHHDPVGEHVAGWVRHRGRTYQ